MSMEHLLEQKKGVIAELREENAKLKRDVQRLYKENRHMKKLAEAWMHDFDKLKAKYEPMMVEASDD